MLEKYSNIETILKRIAIFGALNRSEIEDLLSVMELKEYKEDEVIFKEGSSPKYINIVIEGKIGLFCGKCQTKSVTEGNIFGEVALLAILPYGLTAKAMTDVTLLQLSKMKFHKLSKTDSKLFTKLLLNITREVCRENHTYEKNFKSI